MKIVYLGQAGLLFDTNGMRILVDPYLSDSVAENEPSKHRRTPVDGRFLDLRPDIVICTHAHGDHCDLQTLEHYFTFSSEILLLASRNAWEIVRDFGGERNNYVLFDAGTQWTEKDVLFRAVTAKLIKVFKNTVFGLNFLHLCFCHHSLPRLSFQKIFI